SFGARNGDAPFGMARIGRRRDRDDSGRHSSQCHGDAHKGVRHMGSKAKVAILVVVLAAAAGGGWYYFKNQKKQTATKLTLYGNVDIREVELGFRVSGRLVEVLVDEGDKVAKGQKLAVLDAEPYREAIALAEARVQMAEANFAKFEKGSRP